MTPPISAKNRDTAMNAKNRLSVSVWIATAVLMWIIAVVPDSAQAAAGNNDPRVREPAVAGRFYPADSGELSRMIAGFLKNAVPAGPDKPIAIVSPHAGYVYSGRICTDAFNQAAGQSYDLVVLLGANHTAAGFRGISVYPEGAYRTPLGSARIDKETASRLMAIDDAIVFSPEVHRREHSVEVLVPFVQTLFPEAEILPAVVGTDDPDILARFGEHLAAVTRDRNALIVASSDLSHYPGYADAVRADRKTMEAMISLDPRRLHRVARQQERSGIPGLATAACGKAPVMAAMAAAKVLGANRGRIVSYANSGDTTIGDRNRVVGYGSIAYVRTADPADPNPEPISNPSPGDSALGMFQKQELLKLARNAIQQYMETGAAPSARADDPELNRKRGAFVTLKKAGRLRGCIGYMSADRPLCQTVGSMALQAAFKDRRFRPLAPGELADTEIEISVLTPFQEVAGPEEIVTGRDGVLIRKGGRSAVFLPQVAPEQGWERDEMLAHLCRKAGLPEDGWRSGARLFTFQATVFSETDFSH